MLIKCYTNDQKLYETTMDVVWMQQLMLGPDIMYYVYRGTIKALALQKAASYINLIGSWGINLGCVYLFTFYLNWGIKGLWMAKLILTIFTCGSYITVIEYLTDWHKVIE